MLLRVSIALALAGCSGNADTDPDLPPVDSGTPRDTDISTFPPDTAPDSDISDSPDHTLTMHQWGVWDLTPPDAREVVEAVERCAHSPADLEEVRRTLDFPADDGFVVTGQYFGTLGVQNLFASFAISAVVAIVSWS